MTVLGADADALDAAAVELRAGADELDVHAAALTASLRAVAWAGGVASQFAAIWTGGCHARMVAAAAHVRAAAVRLDQQAIDQRRASARASEPAACPVPEPFDAPGPASDAWPTERRLLDTWEAIVGDADLRRRALDAGSAAATLLADLDVIDADALVDFLTDPAFVAAVDTAEVAIDVGAFVVDVVQDFAAHPALAIDERLFHALADGAVRLGLNEGVEWATQWLFTTAGTVLAPGLGTAGGALLGRLAGVVIGAATDHLADAVDDAAGFVDGVADLALEAYRTAKALGGLAGDALELLVGLGPLDIDGLEMLADEWLPVLATNPVTRAVAGVLG